MTHKMTIAALAAALTWSAAHGAVAAESAPTPPMPAPTAVATPEEELRSTVVNILDALVQKGLLTREQAKDLVADAKAKAAAEAQQRATQVAATEATVEKDAVRVTYVPQIVKDQLATEVGAQVRKDVAAQRHVQVGVL